MDLHGKFLAVTPFHLSKSRNLINILLWLIRVESRLPVEEIPFEDTTGRAEEIALGKPTRRAHVEGESMAPKVTQYIASTSESSAGVGGSEENTASMLTCDNLSTHDATTLFKTDIAGMDLIKIDPVPNEIVPSTCDEISLSKLETANACMHGNLDLKHTTASDVLISIDSEKKNPAPHIAESIDESPKESKFYLSSINDGEDDKYGDEEKEIDVSCGNTLCEGAEESHVAEESHELVTSYQSSHQEIVTIVEEPHRREGNIS